MRVVCVEGPRAARTSYDLANLKMTIIVLYDEVKTGGGFEREWAQIFISREKAPRGSTAQHSTAERQRETETQGPPPRAVLL